MQCSYCQTEMQVATVQIKRSVPPGAKDLGLTDQVTCWKCPKCSLTAELHYERCKCGAIVGPEGVSNRAEELYGERNNPTYKWCTDCQKCCECGKSLKHAEQYKDKIREQNKQGHYYTRYDFYHIGCYRAKVEREKIEYEKEQERRLELRLQREHKQMIETRIRNGLCVKCGKRLGVMDKLAKRQQHSRCI